MCRASPQTDQPSATEPPTNNQIKESTLVNYALSVPKNEEYFSIVD